MRIKRIRELAKLVSNNGLAELEVKTLFGLIRVKITRSVKTTSPKPAVIKPAPEVLPETTEPTYITSPMVGTFYTASGPETESFKKPGDRVEVDEVVCIIEAMKLMNEIKSEVSGTIKTILVGNKQPVEYGQKLFEVISD